MIKAVFFDLDRTLLNRDVSIVLFAQAQYDTFYRYLKHVSKETFVQRFIELDSRGYVSKDRVYRQLVREFELQRITWQDFYSDYRAHFRHYCKLFPDTERVLQGLQQAKLHLGIITNGTGQQMTNIRTLKLETYFGVILISEWEGIKKPDPEIFYRALARLRVSASESVFVGDNPIADMAGARDVGMRTVWKHDPTWDAPVIADDTINHLSELPGTLENLGWLKDGD
jgi:putative hydrolase of the HAD superfamily